MPRIIALHLERMAQTVLEAVRAGDRARLRRLLAPSVQVVETAGARAHARGRAEVAAWLERAIRGSDARVVRRAGRDGIVVERNGSVVEVITFEVRWRITAVRVERNAAEVRGWEREG